MYDLPDLLFVEHDLNSVLLNNRLDTGKYVDSLLEDKFKINSDEQIIEHVYSKYEVMNLKLHEETKEMEQSECLINVGGDGHRYFFDENDSPTIKGIRYAVTIRYSGDSGLWNCVPNERTFNPPRANVHQDRNDKDSGSIEIVILKPLSERGGAQAIKSEIDDTISNIK